MHVAGVAYMLTPDFLADAGVGRMGNAAMAEGVKPNVEKHPRRSFLGHVLEDDTGLFEQLAEGEGKPKCAAGLFTVKGRADGRGAHSLPG